MVLRGSVSLHMYIHAVYTLHAALMFVKCIELSHALKAISSVFDFAEKPKDTILRKVQFFFCQRTVSIYLQSWVEI